jgi:cell wall-associated NlpC family hydrolase
MKKKTKSLSTVVAIVAASTMLTAFAPAATADTDSSSAVSSSRSFKAQAPHKDLLAEATSTDVDNNSDWGGIETLSVQQTQSQAEKDAEAAQKAAEEAAAAQAAQEAASRSAIRSTLSTTTTDSTATINPPNGTNAAAVIAFADQFVGVAPYVYGGSTPSGWDCSGFVQYVFASIGISLPRTSGAQAGVGTAVGDISQAMPGDIIANGAHAGIYIGNGNVVNALNPSQGTQITPVAYAFTGGYSIRRVL